MLVAMICCLNPRCRKPINPDDVQVCQSCGETLTTLLRGRYRAVQPLGQGGFGRTYLALDQDRLNTRCVVKQFSPQMQGTKSLEKAVSLFNQEAVRLDELGEHPQIPTLLAYFEQDHYLYLVQQFVEGQNLLQELRQNGLFSELQIREILNDVLPVLRFIHQRQVIHRDITPTNILRRQGDNRLVLIDFGVAKHLTANEEGMQGGTKIGTEGYSPIEQFRSGKAYPASDIYSLGATCLHLLTATKPENLFDPLRGRWFWREHLIQRGTNVSDQLAGILARMMQDLVSDRYQYVDEVMRDLHADYFRPSLSAPPTTAVPPAVGKPPRGTSQKTSTSPSSTPRPPDLDRPFTSKPPTSQPSNLRSSSARPAHAEPSDSKPSADSKPPASVPSSSQPAAPRSTPARSPAKSWTKGWNCVHTLTGHSSWVTCVALSPTTPMVASSGLDDTVRIWNRETGQSLFTLAGHTRAVNAIAISPHGKTLVSGSDDYTIKTWNLVTGALSGTLTGHSRDVNAVTISLDGQLLISGGEDRTIKLWQMGTGTLLRTLFGVAGMIKSLATSPDGRLVVSGGLDNKIKLWSLQTGEQVQAWTGHHNSVNAVAVTPNSQVIVSGSKDKTIKVWNLQTGALLNTLSDHTRDVNTVAISPDEKTIFSGSSDTTIKLWDLNTGKLTATLSNHTDTVNAIAISADGKTFVSGSSDKTVKVWQLFD